MAVLYLLLGGSRAAHERATFLLKGAAAATAATPSTCCVDGRIAEIGERPDGADGAEVVDADGLVALPGLVDLHTHLREPGREDAETVETGSRPPRSAASPPCTRWPTPTRSPTPPASSSRSGGSAARPGLVDVAPGRRRHRRAGGERLAELGAMADSAARVRVFSDDGHCVADPVLMRRALEYVKAFDGVIAQHAEEPRLTEGAQMHEGERLRPARAGRLAGRRRGGDHRPRLLLAGHVGARLHVCHVSTAGSVEVIRWAKARGIRVTAEVTPHHLLLTDELRRATTRSSRSTRRCGRPPTSRRCAAGLADGTIDIVATDHAPHAARTRSASGTPRPGMLGLETALSVVVETMVEPGLLDWRGVAADVRAPGRDRPARPTTAARSPSGEPANLCWSTRRPGGRSTRPSWPAAAATRPFAGLQLPGRVVATFLRGSPRCSTGRRAE